MGEYVYVLPEATINNDGRQRKCFRTAEGKSKVTIMPLCQGVSTKRDPSPVPRQAADRTGSNGGKPCAKFDIPQADIGTSSKGASYCTSRR